MRRFASLRRQADFASLRRRGRRVSTPLFTLYRSDPLPGDVRPVVGITVNKAIGKAVVRNKLRRRLQAIVHDQLEGCAAARLLFVARPEAAAVDFSVLREGVAAAMRRAGIG